MMVSFLRNLILAIVISSIALAQQVDKVIVSGYGGQHDLDVKNAFLIGYNSHNGTSFTGDIILHSYNLEASFEYAVANDYDLIIRSTSALPIGLYLAPSYPTVELVMPAGSNSFTQTFFGDVINSPVVITGAGVDSNQTAYKLEFFSIDPIGENASSYSNGYIAGQLAFIANTRDCIFDSTRTLARLTGSENGTLDLYNGFGKIQIDQIISSALPVELAFFSAVVLENGVKLNWRTETEVENYGFDIERAELIAGVEDVDLIFSKIGFAEGHGNSNSPKEYSYIDKNAQYGKYAYRLKQIDNDGAFEFSDVIEVNAGEIPKGFVLEQNYPNPFNPATTIKFALVEEENATLKVYDILGNEIATLFNGKTEAGRVYHLDFDASFLPSGIYFYTLQLENHFESRKMVLLK